ncbi:hypothetical protein B11Q_00751 [Corynebacterium diphtheriae]|nr:hypothetical protein B11Q_00751 [Corynebacterium diphtheriae]
MLANDPEVVGSNPAPATKPLNPLRRVEGFLRAWRGVARGGGGGGTSGGGASTEATAKGASASPSRARRIGAATARGAVSAGKGAGKAAVGTARVAVSAGGAAAKGTKSLASATSTSATTTQNILNEQIGAQGYAGQVHR